MKKHEKKTVNVNPLSNQELIDSYDYLATAASSHDLFFLDMPSNHS